MIATLLFLAIVITAYALVGYVVTAGAHEDGDTGITPRGFARSVRSGFHTVNGLVSTR